MFSSNYFMQAGPDDSDLVTAGPSAGPHKENKSESGRNHLNLIPEIRVAVDNVDNHYKDTSSDLKTTAHSVHRKIAETNALLKPG